MFVNHLIRIPMRISSVLVRSFYLFVILLAFTAMGLHAAEDKAGIDQQIDQTFKPAAEFTG